MVSIFDIHKKLGLNHENGLFTRKDTSNSTSNIKEFYQGDFSEYNSNFKVEYALEKLKPHSFFLFNNEPLLLFFDYTQVSKEELEKLSKQVWNFNKSAIAFVNTPKELIVYNGFDFDKKKNLLTTLETIKKVTDLTKIEQFSYWKIVTSELWNAKEEFKKKTRVDTKLLKNIKVAREILIDKNSENQLSEKHANRLIGRLIFVRYLIDRNVNLNFSGVDKKLLTKTNLPELLLQKENLYNFFDYLLTKFKGNLLPLNGEREEVNEKHLQVLANLFAGNDIKSRQKSMFNIFDFDFIPIELISNIYETFLGKKQDSDKAFYTPPFLVDYILEQTVKPFVAKQKNKISCKTVDFTCGSGIFLCETLRTLINRYIELYNPDKSTQKFKNDIKELLVKNIYGNDINEEAIEIAKFSLFITLLDYFNPKDIENFEFPNITKNFYKCDVFESKLDEIFGKGKQVEPDFIIGNPPWGKLHDKSNYLPYIKDREKKENSNIEISNKEFAQAFLLRLSDFSTENTSCQIIVTSKLLYNLNAKKFRSYFLNNFAIDEVLEISSVRHQVFANAVCPAAIIKYKYAFDADTKENVIDYVSLKPNPYFAIFKSILIEKHDYKEIIQNELIKNDWLWKVLVYGHILDYKFIERLRNKEEFPVTLGSLIEDKDNKERPLFASTGIKIGNKNKVNDTSQYKGMYFIETDTKKTKRSSDLQRFYIHFDKNNIWKEDKGDGVRTERVFLKKTSLFIRKGLTVDFKLVTSLSYISTMFTDGLFAIKSKNEETHVLESLLGGLASDLMQYYLLLSFSSVGVEREQIMNEELLSFPIIKNKNIAEQAKHLIILKRLIEIHKKKTYPDNLKIAEYETLFQQKEVELNKLIFDLYNLSDTERDLISYAQEITIPILQAKKKPFREIKNDVKLYKPYKTVEEPEIESYISVIKNHFAPFNASDKKGVINAVIYQSKNILAIEFRIEQEIKENKWSEYENSKMLDLFASTGFQRVSNQLFIQKDVKVLRKKSFTVMKIKQYKYWHKAIAKLDAVEFTEAMIQSQNQKKR